MLILMVKKSCIASLRAPLFAAMLVLWFCTAAAETSATATDGSTETADKPGPVIAPYAWAINMTGTVGLNGLAVPLNLQTAELLRGVKSAGMGYLQWPTTHGFFYAEGLGIDFGQKKFQPLFNQSVEASLYMGEIGYGWNFDVDTRYPVDGVTQISPYLGARKINVKVKVDGPLLVQTVKQDWLTPVIGVIAQGPLCHKLAYVVKLDAGGFNRQGSDYRSALAMLRYSFDSHWAVALGYRASRFKSSDTGNGLTMDLTGKGPLAGLQYTF